MRVAVEQLLRLQQESGSIKKQAILRENKDNEDFRKLLYYALNPMLTYKISEQTLRTPGVYDPGITLTMCDIYEVCEALSRMKALNSATIYQVRGFLQYFCKRPCADGVLPEALVQNASPWGDGQDREQGYPRLDS